MDQEAIANKLNEGFLRETESLVAFLIKTKTDCDDFDLSCPTKEEQIAFILKNIVTLKAFLDQHFSAIWEITASFDKNKYLVHQKYYQEQLVSFFEVSPYNNRVYKKPLGYPGDYVVMLYIYEDGFEGTTTYAKLIHKYSMVVPAAIANRNRRHFYKKFIIDAALKHKNPLVTSIASGPAVEIFEALKEHPKSRNASFTCLDFEKEAFEYVKGNLFAFEQSIGEKLRFNFINANILALIKKNKLQELIKNQDLIYCSGLIDYFDDKMAARMIENLFESLNENGTLIVGNVSADNPTRAFIEMLGGWKIIHRDESQLLGLASNIKNAKELFTEYEATSKMNIFLVAKK